MLSVPETSITLTEDEAARADAARVIIANLQTEIAIHTKNVVASKSDIARLTEQQRYEQEQLDMLSSAVESKENELNVANGAIEQKNEELAAMAIQISKKAGENDDRSAELDAREATVAYKELSLQDLKEELEVNRRTVEEDKEYIRAAKTAFTGAVESIKWK